VHELCVVVPINASVSDITDMTNMIRQPTPARQVSSVRAFIESAHNRAGPPLERVRASP
jgi:hypothetical protein